MSRLGLRMKGLREAKAMTQKQLAKSLGVSESFINEVESGRRVPNEELVKRISKILEQDIGQEMITEADNSAAIVKDRAPVRKPVKKEVQEVWNDAFESILKAVPVYESYNLDTITDTRQLPILSNKVEGCPKDKVFFIKIQENDMIGFRMVQGDFAFACHTQEMDGSSIYLLEYNDKRQIRQVKKLDHEKILLIYNNGRLMTEAVSIKDIKIVAKLIKLEIKL